MNRSEGYLWRTREHSLAAIQLLHRLRFTTQKIPSGMPTLHVAFGTPLAIEIGAALKPYSVTGAAC